ncbi:MAG: WD40 repeat domain-containing protein, partial [Pirellulaceae bacterium]
MDSQRNAPPSRLRSNVLAKLPTSWRFLSWLMGVIVGAGLVAAPPRLPTLMPPESALPVEAYPIGNDAQTVEIQGIENQDVPDEGVLPAKKKPVDNAAPSKPTPDESVLPQGEQADTANDGFPEDARPWLRLDLKGHTGVIRCMDWSVDDNAATLVSAGEDKDVHVWTRSALTKHRWVHRRTIRWPVLRGPRGRIYSVALRDDQVALAGHGATGGLGEIWIVDVETGELVRALVGDDNDSHRQTIATLRWSPKLADSAKPVLVSVDVEGRVLSWQSDPATGIWRGRTLVRHDIETYGAAVADALRSRRRFVPLTFLGLRHIVVAKYVGPAQQPVGAAKWQLERIDIKTLQATTIRDSDMIEFVVAMDASDDGRVLIATDALGNAKRFRFDQTGSLIDMATMRTESVPVTVNVDADGGFATIATAASDDDQKGTLQYWDLQPDQPERRGIEKTNDLPGAAITLPSPISDTFRQTIYGGGSRLYVHRIDDAGKIDHAPTQELATRTGAVTRIAFLSNEKADDPNNGTYQIAVARDGKEVSEVFDLSAIRLLGQQPIDTDRMLKVQRLSERWTARLEPTDEGARYRLYRGDEAAGLLPLIPELHGAVISIATIPNLDNKDAAGAIVVGTNGRNNLYVFAAEESNPPRLIRQFRGHTGGVLSMSVSADSRYLVSGADDATLSIWNLQDCFTATPTVNLWGVDFEVNDNRLIASTVRDDGPLYFRGVRGGDRLISMRWADRKGIAFAESDPAKMLAALQSLSFDTLVVFEFTRLGRPRQAFQSFPAWRQLATVMIDRDRQWAFWTPAGYYDASINGHRRFGWQINRGVRTLPDYYRAAQFRETL